MRLHKPIWLKGSVDEDMLVVAQEALFEAKGQNVHFYLNSTGGSEDEGLAICDLFDAYPGKITVTVCGSAQSMAAVILQAADTRYSTKNSYLMIHQGDMSLQDVKKKDAKALMRMSDLQDDICDEILLQRIQKKYPKYSWTEFRRETNNDVYFTAEQAVKWGLIDRIVK